MLLVCSTLTLMATAPWAFMVLSLSPQTALPLRTLIPVRQEFFLSLTLLLTPLLLKLLKRTSDCAHVNPHSLYCMAGMCFSENMRPGRRLYTSTNQDTEKRVRNDLGCWVESPWRWHEWNGSSQARGFLCILYRAKNLHQAMCVHVSVYWEECLVHNVYLLPGYLVNLDLTVYMKSSFGCPTCLNLNSLNMLPICAVASILLLITKPWCNSWFHSLFFISHVLSTNTNIFYIYILYIYIYIWMMLEKTLKIPLDCKEIKSVNPKGNWPWIFIGRCWSWSSNTLATWCEELTHWKRP